MKEEWRPCVGFEDFYEVSSLGRVRSIAIYSAKYKRIIPRRMPKIRVQETTKEGYKRVLLCLYGVHYHWAVHRLVAFAFIPNPENLPCVNHKDEDTANNRADNLEWCTEKYNSNYGTLPKRIAKRQTNASHLSKAVYQYTLAGLFVTAYPSQKEASRQTGVSSDMIGRNCRGKSKTAGGFIFKFAK